MTAVSRAAQFAKIPKVLKKHYKSAPSNSSRNVMEQLLFACCLEDAHHDAAEEAFAALVHTFFDWNEVRVTSIAELSEVMSALPDSRAAANRVKRLLHAVFEATFNFDLEDRKKGNLGPTVKWFEKLDGATPFTVAYVVQNALGGHAIPVDTGTLQALHVLDLVTDKDAAAGAVPGLERAVAKSKGPEYAYLLHELGADFSANPYSSTVREILLQINPDVGPRLPKRRVAPKPAPQPEPVKGEKKTAEKGDTPAKADKHDKPANKPAKTEAKPAGKTPKDSASDNGKAKAPAAKPGTKKKPVAAQPPAKKKTSSHESPAKAKTLPRGQAPKRRSASEGLAKRKPR